MAWATILLADRNCKRLNSRMRCCTCLASALPVSQSGEWLELSLDKTAIAAEFADYGQVLINVRRAADLAGATPMDRPEWASVAPVDQVLLHWPINPAELIRDWRGLMAAWSTFRKMCSVSRYSQAVRLMTLIRLSALSSTLVVSGLLSLGVMLSVVDNDTFESEFSPKICVGTKPGQKGLEIPGPHDVKLGRARVRSNAGGDAI